MKTRYINQSPYNKVLWWAIFIKHNLKFELVWAGLMLCNVLLEIAQHRTYLTLQFRFNIQERVILKILKLHPPNLYAILLQLFHSWTV